MKSLYTIIFNDGTTYKGGDYSNTGWLDIPNKFIKRIIYRLPDYDNLVLNGYDSYFHMTEATTDLNGENKGKQKLEFDYIMGKRNGNIICYKINMETGEIEKKIYKESDKFVLDLNIIGWKGKNKEE